jgi:short-subunit dehydrogenase
MSKTIVITGGSDGLGKAIAARLAPKNRVVILSPSEEKLKAAAQEIGCEYKVCDVRDYAQCEKVMQEIGQVDCLVNSAGLWIQGELDQDDPVRIHEVIEVNLLGVINMTKAVIPGMKQQKAGLIININSQAGFYAKAERAVYNATKWGVTGFTKSMQPELAKYGIGVTGLYPGMMKTEMFSKMNIEKDMSKGLDTEDVARTVEFILGFDKPTLFPEIGIKNLEN